MIAALHHRFSVNAKGMVNPLPNGDWQELEELCQQHIDGTRYVFDVDPYQLSWAFELLVTAFPDDRRDIENTWSPKQIRDFAIDLLPAF